MVTSTLTTVIITTMITTILAITILISTSVIAPFIAVKVNYGLQSLSTVILVLTPCHCRNMPQQKHATVHGNQFLIVLAHFLNCGNAEKTPWLCLNWATGKMS